MLTKNQQPLDIEAFKEFLKKHKLKATPQRLAVHDAMLHLGHACADMIAEYIQENSEIKITVASVYNILFSLSEVGAYRRRMSSNNKMYFDVNNFNHAHIYDIVNSSYTDIIDDELFDLVHKKIGKKRFRGYKVDHIDIQIVCHPTKTRKCAKA